MIELWKIAKWPAENSAHAGEFFPQPLNRDASGPLRKLIRGSSSGIQIAFISIVELIKQGGNNNANRDTRKNHRSP